ncbi:MAG: efflux RND transporter periplasmic adaptor subunit [Oligoflexales bacterium]|nr:efflux RND transporter periplasmic adaptor subunit [Oligoflexales bacterium]
MKIPKHIIVLIIFGLCIAGTWFFYKRSNPKEESPSVSYTIGKGNLRLDILATGKVQPDNRLELKAPIPGRIEDIYIEEGENVKVGQTLARMSSTDRAALLDLARSKGKKALKNMGDIFRATPIVAPISGQVIARNVEPGQTISSSDVTFVLSNHPLVVAQVDETDMARVYLHQTVELSLDAYPNDIIQGSVTQIAFESKTVSNVTVYEVKVVPKVVPPHMRSGMTANVRFLLEEKKDVILVPAGLVKQTDEGPVVFMADDNSADKNSKNHNKKSDKMLNKRNIKLGLSDGKMCEVLEGLEVGDIILDDTKQAMSKDSKSTATNPFMPNLRGKMGKPR